MMAKHHFPELGLTDGIKEKRKKTGGKRHWIKFSARIPLYLVYRGLFRGFQQVSEKLRSHTLAPWPTRVCS